MDVSPANPVATPVVTPVVKKPHGGGDRMVRVGKWTSKPSKEGTEFVTKFLTKYFQTEQVWTRQEHGTFVVAVRERTGNTELVEEFRFNRTMEQRFRFTETATGIIEVELSPL
jgi:hypothetical protein